METTPEHAKKYPCPQCNAELIYSAAKDRMICNYCGYETPVSRAGSMTEVQTKTEVDEAVVDLVEEHDLSEGLRMDAAQEGWGTETRSFKCSSCSATITAEPNITATVCPFCGSHHVLAQEQSARVIKPESLLPFQVDQKTAIQKFRTWLGRGWFRPNEVKRIAQNAEARVQGVYLPVWTFDAQTFSRWQAEAGYYYYVTERYTVTVNGRQETRTRQVQKVRWQDASGQHDEFFDDVLIYATRSVNEKILQRIYPFDTSALVPYQPQYLSGWRAEEYQIGLEEAWGMGQAVIKDRIRSACAQEVPGDTHRNLRVQSRFEDITFKHTLLPVWIASYRFNTKVYSFMVNGQTGKVQGEAPISWWKVLLTVFIVLVLLACIVGAMVIFGEASESVGLQSLPVPLQWVVMVIQNSVTGTPALPV
jgi:predicted RNA-binding Zn-ribbon protein involved in translation (DUF1610 family)